MFGTGRAPISALEKDHRPKCRQGKRPNLFPLYDSTEELQVHEAVGLLHIYLSHSYSKVMAISFY